MKKYISCIIFFIIFITFTILMKPSSDILNSSAHNIMEFEFMWNYQKYNLIMSEWSNVEISAAEINTLYDFGWLIGYGGLIFSLNTLLAEKFNNKIKKIIRFAAWAGIIAMSLDITENIILLNLINKSSLVFNSLPFIVSIIALLKFLFVIYGILTFFIFLIYSFINKLRAKKSFG